MAKKKASRCRVGATKNTGSIIPHECLESMIYVFRGERVMLDADLAELYGVLTKALNQAVKRNIKRFPPEFMFQLTKDEFDILKSQSVTSSWGGKRKLPQVFTEQGVAMLSGVLTSDRAIHVNIEIMKTFVRLRKVLASNADLARKMDELSQKLDMHDKEITVLFAEIQELAAIPERKGKIGFKTCNRK